MTDRVVLRAVTGDARSAMLPGELAYMPAQGNQLVFGGFEGLPSATGIVTSVAGRRGDVVLTYHDIAGLAAVAHTGSYNSLTDLPFGGSTIPPPITGDILSTDAAGNPAWVGIETIPLPLDSGWF